MSRMGMLKTAITGRFGLGGQVHGGDVQTDMDVGVRQPDPPNHTHKKDKKNKRSKHDTKQVGPAIMLKPEKRELKHGHDPNKINSGLISSRHIIVEPSMRHMNHQPSTRNVSDFEPSPGMTTKNLQKSMRNMDGSDKKSSIRNLGNSFDNKRSPRVANVNVVANANTEAFDKKTSTRNMTSMGSGEENNSRNTNLNGTNTKGTSSGFTFSKTNVVTTMTGDTFDKKTSTRNTMSVGGIDENNSRNTNLNGTKTKGTTVGNNKSKGNANKKPITRTPIMNSIEEANSMPNNTLKLGTINVKNSRNNNQNDATGRSLSSTGRSPVSISMKSTSSTNTTKSTNSTSTKSVDNASNINHNNVSSANTKNNLSSSTISSNEKNDVNNSGSSMNNKSSHSLSTGSEKMKNADNKTKSRPKPPRKRGPSLVTPAHFNRQRPSTILITRKEMEDILAEKQREEALEAKTIPPKSGTLSTDLWLNAANKEPLSEEFSVASGTSVEEESPLGKSPATVQLEDEYDINFLDIVEEEEMTEHTINSGNQSFDANDLQFTDSIDQRSTKIRFDEYDELQTCLHINDYTKGEITRSWYKREDYDKMVDLARKTASKAVKRERELQEELQSMLRDNVSPPMAGRKNGEPRGDHPAGDDNRSTRSGRSNGSGPDGKRKKPIEYRGLEAWTPEGSQKCRTLKENAIESVWNEQSRQWEEGTFDPEAIADVYKPIAKMALKNAQERALADEKMVKRLEEQENKKHKRTVFHKSKAAMKKTAKNTRKAVGHAAGKVISETGKGGIKIGKRATKALVATATLDPKMMKEAVKVRIQKKKRECKHEFELTTSKAAFEGHIQEMEGSGSISLQESNSKCGFVFYCAFAMF